MRKDPYRYFIPEARDLLEQLNKGVLQLEAGRTDVLPKLFRLAHTLKGAARVVRQAAIADHAHAIEDALAPFRESAGGVPRERIDALLERLDAIAGLVSSLVETGNQDSAPSGKPSVDDAFTTIRADVVEIDALLNAIAESHSRLTTLRRTVAGIDQGRRLTDLMVDQLALRGTSAAEPVAAQLRGRGPREDAWIARSGRAASTAGELRQLLGGIDRHLRAGIDQLERELGQLRQSAEQLRLIPAGIMFTSLERTVRDAAQTLGKSVTFEGRGGGVRLESQVLTAVQAALLQLARNAVAHGIESKRDREAAGKPSSGRVTIDVFLTWGSAPHPGSHHPGVACGAPPPRSAPSRRGHHVVFRCEDDGRGIDLDEVRRMTARRGVPVSEAEKLGAQDLMRLLLRGGISTSPTVTEVSGRGIGLDIVRSAAEQLKGEVTVLTDRGKGTAFDIAVPLFVASLEALIVEVDGGAAAIPLASVRVARRVTPGELSRTPRGDSIVYNGKAIPFLSLQQAFEGQRGRVQAPRTWSAIIVEGASGSAAIGVGRVLGTATIVTRPIPDQVGAAEFVAGTCFDSEGDPQLVLDPDGLVAEALRAEASDVETAPAPLTLLIIDDSLTTRMLEKSILESAGFDVDTAASAEEALESVRRKSYALFLVDIEMPGMDGFTFVERIRSDPAVSDVPVILVTSRDSAEDRQRGNQVGAQGYVVKSEFNQTALLERISRLCGSKRESSTRFDAPSRRTG
jgi:two-component system chemotaxis sensor kinase CheA